MRLQVRDSFLEQLQESRQMLYPGKEQVLAVRVTYNANGLSMVGRLAEWPGHDPEFPTTVQWL